VVRFFLIVQMSNPRNMRRMTVLFSPFNSVMLSIESAKHVIRVIFNYVVLNWTASLGARLNIDCGHDLHSRRFLDEYIYNK
jgi:hypothetical protein